MIKLFRYLWAAPCTVTGLLLAAPAFLFGASVKTVDGVIEVALADSNPRGHIVSLLPFNAITFGHVVIGITRAELNRLRTHEHAHVRQYESWGVIFFLAYPAASLWQWLRGGHAYWDNYFEVQARRAAEITV